MNPLRRLDAFHREHPFASDAIVAGLMLVFLVLIPYLMLGPAVGMFGVPFSPAWLVALDFLIDAALVCTWAFRRRAPSRALLTAIGLCLVILVIGPDFTLSLIVVPMFVHHTAATGTRRLSLITLGIALAGAVACGVKNGWFSRLSWVADVDATGESLGIALGMSIPCAAVVLAAWAFGDVAHTRLIALKAVQDRAHRLEVQAAQERELAAADERNRIAREMHDIVSHSLQVIISQADGARYAAAAKPELALKTLGTIGQTGRSALAEMRSLLGVLRAGERVPSSPTPHNDGTTLTSAAFSAVDAAAERGTAADSVTARAPRRPLPTLTDLPELAETFAVSGLDVELTEEGSALGVLPSGGELAAYRIVQEALTNTLRHGGHAARATVRQAWDRGGLLLEVADTGLGAMASPTTAGTGNGVRGMTERARLFGGTLTAGPGEHGGYTVTARLPYAET